ncbi:MAG: universal stress protein [Candidatus Xenobium sp.]|jgi:nucleotide-binding universal stress UspA family protein|nr:universal stress protein [Burkholderiales bacterium]
MTALETILLPTDFSDCSLQAFSYARDLAEAFAARILLVHVGDSPRDLSEVEEHLVQLGRHQGLPEFGVKAVVGHPAEVLVDLSGQIPEAVMVMSTHGRRGAGRIVLGSTTEAVVSQAHCPVLTVKRPEIGESTPSPLDRSMPEPAPPLHVQRILVPVDFESPARDALAYAAALARRLHSEVLMVHVLDEPHPERQRAAWEFLAELGRRSEVPDSGLFVDTGEPAEVIVALAESKKVDLIVQGTRGRRLVAGLPLGSTASAVVRRASCAVLTVRGTWRVVPLYEGVKPEP